MSNLTSEQTKEDARRLADDMKNGAERLRKGIL